MFYNWFRLLLVFVEIQEFWLFVPRYWAFWLLCKLELVVNRQFLGKVLQSRSLKSNLTTLFWAKRHFTDFSLISEKFSNMLVALEVSICAVDFQISASTSFISGLSPCWLLAVLYCWPIRSPSSRERCRELISVLRLWNLVKVLSFELLVNWNLWQFLSFQGRFYGNIGGFYWSYVILWSFSVKIRSKFHCWNCFLVAWISKSGCKSILWARSHCRMNKFLLINIFEVLVSR